MLLFFSDPKLAKICGSEKSLIRKFGPRQGACIAQRLSELRAFASLEIARQVPHLRLHQLTGEGAEQFALNLIQPYRLILECADDPVPRLDDGGINCEHVTSVTIVKVADYH